MTVHPVRTIRRLDERSETKEICGFKVEKDIPIPERLQNFGKLEKVLDSLEVGESFEHTSRITMRYKKIGAGKRFTQRQIGPKKHRIWRTA